MADDTALRVLELRRAGVGFAQIADRLKLADAAAARVLYDEALTADDLRFASDLEIARLDRLHAAIWPAAVKGDPAAVDRALRISERRERLAGPPRENDHALRNAFDASVETSKELKSVDEALVEAGRKIADRVDAAVATGEGQEVTKALYLVPHMVNVLREALATPASRAAAGVTVEAEVKGKLAQLRAVGGRGA